MRVPTATSDLLTLLESNGWDTQKLRGLPPGLGGEHPVGSTPQSTSDLVAQEAALAYGRIRPFARWTPLEPSAWLSRLAAGNSPGAGGDTEVCSVVEDGEVPRLEKGQAGTSHGRDVACRAWIKLESEQHTGSFKVRGALNKLLSLSPAILSRGVFTASTGNHALAVLYACAALNPTPPVPGRFAEAQPGARAHGDAVPVREDGGGSPEPDSAVGATLDGAARVAGPAAKATAEATLPAAEGALEPCLHAPQGTLQLQLQLYVPQTASPYKLRKLRDLGGSVHLCGTDCLEAETAARAAAAAAGAVYVSPYNDLQVMGGQGTVALELLAERRRGELDVVFVPVGGGGLIAGIASVLKAADSRIHVVGCQPAASDVMSRSVAAGAIQPEAEGEEGIDTLSDATAGGVEDDSLTLQPCMACVDEWMTVSEGEIAAALVELLEEHSKLVEGAAACAIAAFKRMAPSLAGRSAVVVACGGNIAVPTLQKALRLAGRWTGPDGAE